ncbi:MAG: B12-binding domain-containing radical SAM protein [Ardenticatenaceae bacterium]|nr:B12-binding domain-containing radical SAM protein [Ardenticatenaceae bacterium]HBY98316.1 B12-binding domain-containing radical SAM protein [Chloroflexota bacterium]
MDILLAHGYYLDEDPHERRVMKPYPPLGILYLSAYLKSKGFDVGLFDSTFQRRQAFFELVERERPPVVGLYCNLMTKFNVLAMIEACKRVGATVILGGPEPPFYAEEYLARGADIVVTGEGELTLEELLPHLAQRGVRDMAHIKGISYRGDDGQIVKTPDRPFITNLDELPWPDRFSIDLQQYVNVWRKHHGMGSVSLITARGCPFTCKWCSHSVYGVSHRRRSPEGVADEVEWLVAAYAPDMLWYADDVFTIHRTWFLTYAAELKRRGIRIPFECISRADRMNAEVVQALAESGCYRLWIGAESGSQRILDAMDRKTNIERVREMTRLLQQHGIETGMFIMLGYEGETDEDLEATVDHLKESNPDLFLTTVAYPIRGTTYYREVESRVLARLPWEQRTDRDLTVAGRHSKRYYSFATRWMVNEVKLHQLLHSQEGTGRGPRQVAQVAKAFVNSRVGRLGMALSRNEVEA